jgi:peptide/nickel transport system substrate-binding protein
MLGHGRWNGDVMDVSSSRRSRTSALAVMLVLAATGAIAAGCGTSGDDSEDGTPASASSRTVGDALTIATPNVPASLDPATGTNENADYFDLAYDPLIVQAPDGSFEPGLATNWEYGPRNMSFSITLRSGVKFSDGTPLDAEAVKTWINHAMKLPGGRAPTYLKHLKSIEVEGPLQLELKFNAPTPLLELTFSQRLEMGMIGSPRAVTADTLATATAGAGPYMLDKAQTVTGDRYTYVPNPHYWNKDAVHYKRVVIKKIDNPTAALQALKTGQVQVVKDQPVTSIDAAERAGLESVAPETLLMGLSLLDRGGKLAKPLGDVRVRQAMNHAIDRESVAAVIGAGHGRPTAQMAVPGDDSYDGALDEVYPYDPDRAKELLAEAGYPDGFTLPAISTTVVGQDKLGQAIAGQLSKVGINLKLDVKPAVAEYIKQMSAAASPSATLAFGRLPASINYQLLWGPDAATFNPFKTRDPELDDLNEQLSAAPTAEAPAIARQVQALIVNDAWFVPVVATPLVVLYRSDVTGVTAEPERPVIYAPEIAPSS